MFRPDITYGVQWVFKNNNYSSTSTYSSSSSGHTFGPQLRWWRRLGYQEKIAWFGMCCAGLHCERKLVSYYSVWSRSSSAMCSDGFRFKLWSPSARPLQHLCFMDTVFGLWLLSQVAERQHNFSELVQNHYDGDNVALGTRFIPSPPNLPGSRSSSVLLRRLLDGKQVWRKPSHKLIYWAVCTYLVKVKCVFVQKQSNKHWNRVSCQRSEKKKNSKHTRD